MKIRTANGDDAERLALLGSETFWETYRSESKLEAKYIRAYMAESFSVRRITCELNDQKTRFLLAENDGQTAGYAKLMFGKSHESLQGTAPMEISRIYLARKFLGKGLGKELLEACIERAAEANCDTVWLGVWRHNQRAIRFYKKNGFAIVGVLEFDLASSLQKDHVMERLL